MDSGQPVISTAGRRRCCTPFADDAGRTMLLAVAPRGSGAQRHAQMASPRGKAATSLGSCRPAVAAFIRVGDGDERDEASREGVG